MTDNKYDLVPYNSHPYEHTTPEHLAAIATLFGMQPVDFRKARVLEIGCASGGNIIPLAEIFPETEFRGVDLSTKQVEEGRAVIAELGLDNIRLDIMSLSDIGKDYGEFDYIIAHGVYSWVDKELQRKILRVCKSNLSSQGLAFVSYNTLPGWNMVRTIRDMMVYHTRAITDPVQKAAQARLVLQFMIDGMEGDQSPYATMLKNEMNMLKGQGDYYLLHDHMEDNNHPVYFHEFMADARGEGLEYLGDSDPETMLLDNLPPTVAEKLRAGQEIVHIEQYMDFFRNRRFRNTILMHKGIELKRNVEPQKIEEYCLSTFAEPKQPLTEENMKERVNLAFASQTTQLNTSDRLSKLVFKVMLERSGRPIAFKALTEEVARRAEKTPAEVAEYIKHKLNLSGLIFKRITKLRLWEGNYSDSVPEKPEFFRTARVLARKSSSIPNMRHQIIRISPVEQLLIQYVDGTRTVEEIAGKLQEHHQNKQLQLNVENEANMSAEEVKEHLRKMCNDLLNKYCKMALIK